MSSDDKNLVSKFDELMVRSTNSEGASGELEQSNTWKMVNHKKVKFLVFRKTFSFQFMVNNKYNNFKYETHS
jgi:hypothetical protein